MQSLLQRQQDSYLSKEKDHGHSHFTSYDVWLKDMDPHKTSGKEAGSGLKKHEKIVIEHQKKRKDSE